MKRNLLASFGLIAISLMPTQVKASVDELQYISPLPNSILNHKKTTVAFRTDETVNSDELAKIQVTARGEQSGLHVGNIKLADDKVTVIASFAENFAPDETVNIEIDGVVKQQKELKISYSFSISPNLRNEVSDYASSNSGIKQEVLSNGQLTQNKYLTVPSDFPNFIQTVPTSETGEGLIFSSSAIFAPSTPAYVFIVDDSGDLVFYRKVPAKRCESFLKHSNGLASYYVDPAAINLIDSSYMVVNKIFAQNGYVINDHGIQINDDGYVLLQIYDDQPFDMSKVIENGNPLAYVTGSVIQVLDLSGNPILQWRSWDHANITDAADDIDLQGTLVDPFHSNSVEWDIDGNVLVSFRHRNEIMKIDRLTGKTIWHFGGKKNEFLIEGDYKEFALQHDVRRLPNGNITIFDNGNKKNPFSRALEYQIDEQNKVARKVWEYRNKPNDVFSPGRGNVQRLSNGNSLICWGGLSNDGDPFMTEVNAQGEKVFEVITSNRQEQCYRSQRFDWQGFPVEPPRLVLNTDNEKISLYFSWNGATNVSGYKIYGGQTLSNMSEIATVAKNGFETSFETEKPRSNFYYKIQPVDKDGNTTPFSNTVFFGNLSKKSENE